MIGEIINEKYKIESIFSESHMYEIFTAIEAATGQTVVMKLMKEEMAVNSERVRCFSEEIKNFASLSHPNIAEVLDLDVFEGRPYVVSPFIDGKELNLVMKDEILSLPDSVKIIQDLAAVLQCAADHKIENRNINLSNVLRTKNGHITVLSFTLPRLKLVNSTTIKRSENASIQADLYFLGTALFELLAGESPIRKIGGLNELWDMKLEKDLRIRHPELNPSQQDKIIDFIRKTLTREMDQRFNSYEDFLIQLADLASVFRQSNTKNKITRQMSMASHVVDVLNGRVKTTSNITSFPKSSTLKPAANENLAASAIRKDSNRSDNNKDFQVGYAEDSYVEGNLALVIDNSNLEDNEKEVIQSKPILKNSKLKLVKPSKNIKTQNTNKKQPGEWAEDNSILKNPVLVIGFALIVMVLLILFW